MRAFYFAPGGGLDSARALPVGGSGFVVGHRDFPPRKCGQGAKHPGCGREFVPVTPNGKYCEECRRKRV